MNTNPTSELKAIPEPPSEAAVQFSALLADVLRYRRGLGRYNFSNLKSQDRAMAALEAWEELETRIEITLSNAGVEVR